MHAGTQLCPAVLGLCLAALFGLARDGGFATDAVTCAQIGP